MKNVLSSIETKREWKDLSFLVCVPREGEREEQRIEETAYFISKKDLEAKETPRKTAPLFGKSPIKC